jgi:L-ascorbate metabolism protein UlaG (beta-lactamase superfamily)
MSRRHFIKRLLAGLKTLALIAMAPLWGYAAASKNKEDTPLHYTPLNGRALKDIAHQKEHHGPGHYLNPLGPGRQGRFWQVLYWKLLHENRFRRHFKEEPEMPLSIDWGAIQRHNGLSITFLKHASLMINDNGRRLLIDPIFSDIYWFIRDFTPSNDSFKDMPAPHHVLITHGHYDHLDKPSLSTLDKGTHVIAPLGYDDIFQELKMNNRTALDWFQTYQDGNLEVTFLPCNHWTMRNPLVGPNRALWGSYLIRTSGGYTIYLSGDTAYFDGFDQIGAEYSIDLAVFNLGAYEPRWFMAPSHLNPVEAVQAFGELKAKKMMIVHWGTFRLGDEPVHFPPMQIKQELEEKGLSDRLVDLRHGQTLFASSEK